MKTVKFLSGISLIIVMLLAFPSRATADGGKMSGWPPDERVPGYLDDTFTPFLLTDHNRTVHAFASQANKNRGGPKAIVYRQWTLAGGWTRPVDIMLSPIGGDAIVMGAYLDSRDTIHMIFAAEDPYTAETSVYYSSAPAANANWAPAWSAPTLIGAGAFDLNSGAIVGDDQGTLIIIYSGNRDGSGVYYVESRDFGRTWSDSLPIFLTYDSSLIPFSVRLTVGSEQKIRATWNIVTSLGVDEALYFASFDPQTDKWDSPIELDRRIDLRDYFGPSYPAIVDNGTKILVVYNSGNPFTGRPVLAGRPIQRVRVSADGGITWNEPLDPFPLHLGRSGEHALVLDGSGTPHLLFIQRIEPTNENGNYTIIGGIWHSTLQNGGWSNPDRFVPSVAPHDIRAVVVQGNVLLAVWRQDPGSGQSGIWYSYLVLNLPELPVIPLATTSVNYSIQPSVGPLPTGISTVIAAPSARPELLNIAPPSTVESNPAFPMIVGIVPVVLILIGLILYYRFINSRRD